MFLFQAQKAFNIWHNIEPKIDEKVIKFLMKVKICEIKK